MRNFGLAPTSRTPRRVVSGPIVRVPLCALGTALTLLPTQEATSAGGKTNADPSNELEIGDAECSGGSCGGSRFCPFAGRERDQEYADHEKANHARQFSAFD